MTLKALFACLTLLIVGAATGVLLARPGVADSLATGVTATSTEGRPACWVLLGNKLYFVEKDNSSVLKVSASGVL